MNLKISHARQISGLLTFNALQKPSEISSLSPGICGAGFEKVLVKTKALCQIVVKFTVSSVHSYTSKIVNRIANITLLLN